MAVHHNSRIDLKGETTERDGYEMTNQERDERIAKERYLPNKNNPFHWYLL
ncbi:MAG: hypothetical protein Q4P30_03825 [Eubacteriales bacterium]|nr:hypothetical protein [Eubacteriales bacterium]